ncbi:MAG: hypothetical protein K0R54_786 [Clostridiaceae bacterium]|jgi:hypothetical protein|nr:hypothetical protein [Clostridiaceae bacterium]
MKLEDLKRFTNQKYINRRQRPMGISLSSVENDRIRITKLKSYKLMYGEKVATMLFKAECVNEIYENKLHVCEYFIKELLDEVKKNNSDNEKLIKDTEHFITNIFVL